MARRIGLYVGGGVLILGVLGALFFGGRALLSKKPEIQGPQTITFAPGFPPVTLPPVPPGGLDATPSHLPPLSSLLPQPKATSPQPAPPPASSPAAIPLNVTVHFLDSGFTPREVTVRAGGTVVFENTSLMLSVQPASNPHPVHNGYPQKGGCSGNAFDACQAIPRGGSWSFRFDMKGVWSYHDHLHPNFGGTIVVQ